MGKKATKASVKVPAKALKGGKKVAPPAKTVKKVEKKIKKAVVKAKLPIAKAPAKSKGKASAKVNKAARNSKAKLARSALVKKAVPKKTSTPPKVASVKALAGPKPPKAPKAASAGPKGYTSEQGAKFKDFKKQFDGYSNQALKDLLRKNMQSMSGNKDELVFKCADGATLGRIPRCPSCFGGRPKFDNQKGTYYCSGYRDDEDFKNCHTTFQKSELKRDTWEP